MFEFDGGAGNGIGKAGDGDDGAAARMLSKLVVDTQRGKERAQKDHTNGHPQFYFVGMQPKAQKIIDALPDTADAATHRKCPKAVLANGGIGGAGL